jgi:hypothetical protein
VADGTTYKFKVVITVGPTDQPVLDVFRWMMAVLIRIHDDPPGPVKVRVERI